MPKASKGKQREELARIVDDFLENRVSHYGELSSSGHELVSGGKTVALWYGNRVLVDNSVICHCRNMLKDMAASKGITVVEE